METRKSRVRTNCLPCGKNVSGTAVVILTKLPEDSNDEYPCVAHEGRQNAPMLDQTYRNAMIRVSTSGYNA